MIEKYAGRLVVKVMGGRRRKKEKKSMHTIQLSHASDFSVRFIYFLKNGISVPTSWFLHSFLPP